MRASYWNRSGVSLLLCNVKISPDHLMISSPDHLITFSPNYLVQQCSESRVKLSLPTKNLVSSLFCSDLQMQGPSPPKRICPSDLTFSAQMSLPFFLPKQHHLRYYTITYLSNSSVLSNFFFLNKDCKAFLKICLGEKKVQWSRQMYSVFFFFYLVPLKFDCD